MPFSDELRPVEVVSHDPAWAGQAAALSEDLRELVPDAVAIEHIGSTSIPDLVAKNCLDLMVVVNDLAPSGVASSLIEAGWRLRPEPWNRDEPAAGRIWPKWVFAPPDGQRRSNLHVRTADSGTARVALLFRDHLRAHPTRVEWWSQFKQAAAAISPTLADYAELKYPTWHLLMDLAEDWASDTGWRMPPWWTGTPPRPRAVTVVLRDQSVLLVWRRRAGRTYCVVPGGGVEPGETVQAAAWRELAEETSLSADSLQPLMSAIDQGRTSHYFIVHGATGAPLLAGPEAERNLPDNHYELRWTPLADLDRAPLQPPSARSAIELAIRRRG